MTAELHELNVKNREGDGCEEKEEKKRGMWREDREEGVVRRGTGSKVEFSCKHTALPSGSFSACLSPFLSLCYTRFQDSNASVDFLL